MPIVDLPTFKIPETEKEIIIGISASGTIAKTTTYQTTIISEKGDPLTRRRVQLQYDYHIPVQPNSEAQLAWMQNFANGMTTWGGLDLEQKEVWNEKAREEYRQRAKHPGSYRIHSGCNLFMRWYLNNL